MERKVIKCFQEKIVYMMEYNEWKLFREASQRIRRFKLKEENILESRENKKDENIILFAFIFHLGHTGLCPKNSFGFVHIIIPGSAQEIICNVCIEPKLAGCMQCKYLDSLLYLQSERIFIKVFIKSCSKWCLVGIFILH